MNSLEFVDRVCVSSFIAVVRQVALTCVNDHPGHVQTAAEHLTQVDLRRQVLRIVDRCREVRCVDVVMGIERDHVGMDLLCFSNERIVGSKLLGVCAQWREKNNGREYSGEERLHKFVSEK